MANIKGTCSILEETYGTVKKIKWSWTAGSSASVDDLTGSSGVVTTTNVYNGKIQALHTVGGTGSTAPSASYDITIKDGSSVDILLGAGANRAAATEHTAAASLGCVANDTLTLATTNTGSANTGVVYLFIR